MCFEDGHSRPALVNVGIRKGLWSYAERFEAAFRAHSGTGSVRGPRGSLLSVTLQDNASWFASGEIVSAAFHQFPSH